MEVGHMANVNDHKTKKGGTNYWHSTMDGFMGFVGE